MNYPTGLNKTYTNNIVNYKNRGMALESLINEANEYYLENEIAVIYKKPTPIGLIDVDYKKGEIKKAYFKDKSTFDYNGIYKEKYIEFEAKESHSRTSFPYTNIHPHQFKHLERIIKQKGICFFIININSEYFILKGEDLMEYKTANERKSIPISYFEKNCHKIPWSIKPSLDYIKIIDEIYFKGE